VDHVGDVALEGANRGVRLRVLVLGSDRDDTVLDRDLDVGVPEASRNAPVGTLDGKFEVVGLGGDVVRNLDFDSVHC